MIFKAAKKIIGKIKPNKKSKTKKVNKKLKAMPKLTAEQKTARRKRIKDAISKGAKLVTKYEGGKPKIKVIPSTTKIEKDTFTIFGNEIKKNYVYLGSAVLLLGATSIYYNKQK